MDKRTRIMQKPNAINRNVHWRARSTKVNIIKYSDENFHKKVKQMFKMVQILCFPAKEQFHEK